ncbi:MAG: hypothetical protein IPK81_23755 [Rhodospirillales bacterium]|nr:MAG: hypothetical protein IPK81_23755 [Rhodospirillales bacterium]
MTPIGSMTRLVGFSLVGIGVAIGALNWASLTWWNTYYPKLLASAPVFGMIGLGVFAFPGVEPPDGLDPGARSRHFFGKAPLLHKIAWAVSGIIGLAAGGYALHRLGYFGR